MFMLGLTINTLLALLVMRDAARRGEHVVGWTLFALLCPFVGYAVWRSVGVPGAGETALVGRGRARGRGAASGWTRETSQS